MTARRKIRVAAFAAGRDVPCMFAQDPALCIAAKESK